MAKRGATTVINHDNWDDPYEPEIAGKFKPAGQEDLQKRVIKTAKRRITTQENSVGLPGENKNVFASFGGFKPAPPTSDSGKLFGFLGTNPPTNKSSAEAMDGDNKHSQGSTQSTSQQQYLSSLQQLNQNVSDWIKSHVDSNPFCILTPVFNDYDKHLKEIQKERDAREKSTPLSSAPGGLSSFNFSTSSENKFNINIPTTPSDNIIKNTGSITDNKVTTSSLNIDKPSLSGYPPDKTSKSPLMQGSDTNKPSLFSSFKSDSTSSSLFAKPDPASLMVNPFTSGLKKDDKPQELTKPFSFSNGSTSTSFSNNNGKDVEEDSEEPPKVEFIPVQEEGSIFSTRCKVFVKKEKNYTDRGVGTLFIKKVGEDKHQMLVRAETVLGNVLVNVLLSSGVPLQRMGKNNVMLVCVPTPQDVPPPTTVLLRVKTADEADDLLATLLKYTN